MVDFRRVITALAVLALFTGLASAQVGGTGQSQLTCSTNVTVTPTLRGEGYTEQTGDITITCTGGVVPAVGAPIPLVNFTIFYNTGVTSRLYGTGTNIPNEALLLIDEPGSGLTGEGPARGQKLCTTPLTGCVAVTGNVPNASGVGTTIGSVVPDATGGATTVFAPTVYQGTSFSNSSNAITFFGVPALPPGSTGQRVYRITNVRVDATKLAGGPAAGASSQVTGSISISGSTSLGISNPTAIVGYVAPGLSASASSAVGVNQCSSVTKGSVNTISFTENFGTAFKTRVFAKDNSTYAGQGTNILVQNVPGGIYNSESNFVFPLGGTQVAGLTDYGTRLKATFNNVPASATLWVSTVNVLNNSLAVATPSPVGGSGGNTGTSGYAQLVVSETSTDGTAGAFFPVVGATDNGPTTATIPASGGVSPVPIAAVATSGGTGSAVWEVVNTNPNTSETLKFAVYITYAANSVPAGAPPSTVTLSYAPTGTSNLASSTLTVPRFTVGTAAPNLTTLNTCRTVLLYPFITNQAGFDTGISIANTSTDPFGTTPQANTCTVKYYGGTTAAPTVNPPDTITPTIGAGTTNGPVYAQPISVIAPTFQGYAFAICNFQFAHGFAAVGDVGFRNLFSVYLALVVPDPGTGSRAASPPCQGISGCSATGENVAH